MDGWVNGANWEGGMVVLGCYFRFLRARMGPFPCIKEEKKKKKDTGRAAAFVGISFWRFDSRGGGGYGWNYLRYR